MREPTLIEVLVIIAILGIIAAVVALNVGNFFGRGSTNTTENQTMFEQLSDEPISSLNITQLTYMADTCALNAMLYGGTDLPSRWAAQATMYQNQIIIELLQQEGA